MDWVLIIFRYRAISTVVVPESKIMVSPFSPQCTSGEVLMVRTSTTAAPLGCPSELGSNLFSLTSCFCHATSATTQSRGYFLVRRGRDRKDCGRPYQPRYSNNVPCQFVTVPRVKNPSGDPRCAPLAKRISHDDEGQNFAERSRSKTFRGNQRNQHIIRAHRETKQHYEYPDHRGPVRNT